MSKVDILLATYNGAQFLTEQLDSILNQSFKDFRLIISDDNSTDNTKKILDDYKEKDERIIVYKQKKNLGIVKNFEFLLEKVEAELFMFSDQDDIWNEKKIEKSIDRLEKTKADLVYSDLEVVDKDLKTTYKSYWKLKGLYRKIKKYNNFDSLYLNNFMTGCTMMCKSSFIPKIIPMPNTSKFILHDYWVALMVSQEGKIAYIKEPLIKYRQHKNNKIGSRKESDTFKTLDEIRNLFIRVKIEHFTVFVENESRFNDLEKRRLANEALIYFENLKQKYYWNFSKWGLFFKLYKYEDFGYKMKNFLILNLPFIVRPIIKAKNRNK